MNKKIISEKTDVVFLVCAPWARSNGCKSRTRSDSGKCIPQRIYMIRIII